MSFYEMYFYSWLPLVPLLLQEWSFGWR
jgi:hypothetical protein